MNTMGEGLKLQARVVEAINHRDYDALDEALSQDFVDHHPGLVDVTSLAVYKRNLAFVNDSLQMKATVEHVVEAGDMLFTHVKLTGKHVGPFFGIEPTGNALAWYTNELWRMKDGKLVERWAVDDLVSVFSQMGVPMPSWG
ncbi:hypothetical protein D7V97_08075 [Corallococcus sp. CA053C]|uniref:ester cyclase n=1 Tax=Corallococcus sp. CA053C TaxID=2316732 RepID=UPI000EA11CEA|nr:ester cyclase [Corallococcus sp. CA053C]RKH12584.1 hypothetical protein D7V97_08075 [Corallococcus sp. CA053C]